jgi:hypothetical protein
MIMNSQTNGSRGRSWSNWWKRAGIVDAPSDKLSNVFEPGSTRMRADVVAKINSGLQTIKSYLDSAYPGVKIVSHEVIGAAVTYQYTEKSDIDTTVFINIGENDPRFKVINDWIGDNVDGKMYHEKRPFQFKIKPAAYIGQQDANADAIYDPTTGEFKKRQNPQEASASFRGLIESGRSEERRAYQRMEEEIRGMTRSWANVGRKALQSGRPDEYAKWLTPQAQEILNAWKRIKDMRGESYDQPTEPTRISQNWGAGNIIFKFLERDGYIDLFKMIKASLADGSVHPDELKASVEMAEKIMSQNIGYNPHGERGKTAQMLTITSQSSARNDRKAYFMVDIEADGQSPAVGSMIELGCVLVDDPSKRFTVLMKPDKESYSEKSLSISGKTREETMTYPDPKEGMEKFRNWILETSGGRSPIFVSDNGFDWNFVDYYFHKYLGSNPFGYSPRNLHDLHKGFRGSLSSRLSDERGNLPHAAVEDAAMNATHMQRLIDEGLSH